MKKIILGAAAATLIASPILAAAPASAADRHGRDQHMSQTVRHEQSRTTSYRSDDRATNRNSYRYPERNTYRAPTRVTYHQTYRPAYRTWKRGERFDSRYASNYRVISDYRDYGLQAPPYGYRWAQSGNDAVLVSLASGLIGAVLGGAIH
jgi:Ni/Co efflux regulator RcnB